MQRVLSDACDAVACPNPKFRLELHVIWQSCTICTDQKSHCKNRSTLFVLALIYLQSDVSPVIIAIP